MSLNVHFLQNASFEVPGSILEWAKSHRFQITQTEFYQNNWSLPEMADLDLLIIMGGPMSAYDDDICPWLKTEKRFIKQAITAGKKVIGVCLGAQLLASILGAKVYPHKHKEIGFLEIEKLPEAKGVNYLNHLNDHFTVFHWHGDTFDLPVNCKQLFRSAGCEQQGFAYGTNVLALQFHMEVTPKVIQGFLDNGSNDLSANSHYVQTIASIKDNFGQTNSLRPLLFELLDKFMVLVAQNSKPAAYTIN